MSIKWSVNKREAKIIASIAQRAVSLATANGIEYAMQDAQMDLTATHANGCPLRLWELASASDNHFGHDVLGIRKFLDRASGKLPDYFLPRFAA